VKYGGKKASLILAKKKSAPKRNLQRKTGERKSCKGRKNGGTQPSGGTGKKAGGWETRGWSGKRDGEKGRGSSWEKKKKKRGGKLGRKKKSANPTADGREGVERN